MHGCFIKIVCLLVGALVIHALPFGAALGLTIVETSHKPVPGPEGTKMKGLHPEKGRGPICWLLGKPRQKFRSGHTPIAATGTVRRHGGTRMLRNICVCLCA